MHKSHGSRPIALDVAQAVTHEAIYIAQGVLKATDEITNGPVAAANAALEGRAHSVKLQSIWPQ